MNKKNKFKITEWATTLILILAIAAIGWHIYEANRTILYVDITSPIELSQTDYALGDKIIAKRIQGERFLDSNPTITRELQCDSQKMSLKIIPPGEIIAVKGAIDVEDVTIAILNSENLQSPERNSIKPDANCSITFQSCDIVTLPLGGERDDVCARYFTDTFNIIERGE